MFAKRFSNILTRALHCREDISPGIRRFIVTTMFAERLYNAYIKSFYGGKLKRLNQDLEVGLDQWKSFALLLNYFILALPYFFVLFFTTQNNIYNNEKVRDERKNLDTFPPIRRKSFLFSLKGNKIWRHVWVGRSHETLSPLRLAKVYLLLSENVFLLHKRNPNHLLLSLRDIENFFSSRGQLSSLILESDQSLSSIRFV